MSGPKDKRKYKDKLKEREFKKRHEQWIEGLKEKRKNPFHMEPYKVPGWNQPEWNQDNLTPEEKWKKREKAKKYQAHRNNRRP